MAVSVRMDPLLERQLELAAQRQGITKSQFIISAVERALGRKNPYELLLAIEAREEARATARTEEPPYDTVKSRKRLIQKLRAKHGVGRAG